MKPKLLKVIKDNASQSFSVRRDLVPYVNNQWHYHPEIELIHFREGYGMQFIGDSIKRFKSGDLILIGANLPHYWRFDDSYFKSNPIAPADVAVAHFRDDFWGDRFFNLPENIKIKMLLEKAKRGVRISGSGKSGIERLLQELLQAENETRLILLIKILHHIANYCQVTPLSATVFTPSFEETETDRVNTIYEYILTNFNSDMLQQEVAAIAHVSPGSFGRYFKSRTGKTYSRFLLEVKVNHACKLLFEDQLSIKNVCYKSGFNNFTSFHKYFKIITGKTPFKYQKDHKQATACPDYN